MAALGDFGGFNDGVILIPAILMSIYSQKMFSQELFGEIPVKSESNTACREKMREKCSTNLSPFELEKSDCELLDDESKRIKRWKNSWFISLCFSKCICKRERGMLLQEKAIERFDQQLDIRSIVKTRIDLSILLSLLLSKEQLLLFRNQHARAFVDYNESKKEGEEALLNESSAHHREDPDFAQWPNPGLRATFEGIKGFEVQSDLDRKLILGVWQNTIEDQEMVPRARAAELNARSPGDASKTVTDQNMLSADDLSVSVDHQQVLPQNYSKKSLTQAKYKKPSKIELGG